MVSCHCVILLCRMEGEEERRGRDAIKFVFCTPIIVAANNSLCTCLLPFSLHFSFLPPSSLPFSLLTPSLSPSSLPPSFLPPPPPALFHTLPVCDCHKSMKVWMPKPTLLPSHHAGPPTTNEDKTRKNSACTTWSNSQASWSNSQAFPASNRLQCAKTLGRSTTQVKLI